MQTNNCSTHQQSQKAKQSNKQPSHAVKHKVWIAVYSESEMALLKQNFAVFVILSNHLVWQFGLQEAILNHLLPIKPSRFLCNQIPTY